MTFFETFTAVFMATLLGQISLWLIERYMVKHIFNKALDKMDRLTKRIGDVYGIVQKENEGNTDDNSRNR